MRFGTVDDRLVLVRESDGGYLALDVSTASGGVLPADAVQALAQWDDVLAWAGAADWSAGFDLTPERLGAPVPNPRQVFAIALNYAPHAAEAGFTPPPQPLVFTKFASCITGPVSTVELPDGNVDWEIEVVAVVGRGGFRIPRDKAWDALAGVTLGQDLSERVFQLQGVPPSSRWASRTRASGRQGPCS